MRSGDAERLGERHLGALLVDLAIEHRELGAAGMRELQGRIGESTGPPASIGVDSVCTVSSGCPSSALSRARAATAAPSAAVASFSAVASASSRLHHLEPRRVAGVEARLGGIAARCDRSRSFPQHRQPCVGDEHVDSRRAGRRCGPARSSPPAPPRRRESSPRSPRFACRACRRARAAPRSRTPASASPFRSRRVASGLSRSPATARPATLTAPARRAAAIVGLAANARSIARLKRQRPVGGDCAPAGAAKHSATRHARGRRATVLSCMSPHPATPIA